MDPSFKIVIVIRTDRAAILEDGLREAGHVQVVRIDEWPTCSSASTPSTPEKTRHPDRPGTRAATCPSRCSRSAGRKRPVAMFVDQAIALIEAASMPASRPTSSGACARSVCRTSSIFASPPRWEGELERSPFGA